MDDREKTFEAWWDSYWKNTVGTDGLRKTFKEIAIAAWNTSYSESVTVKQTKEDL